MVDLQTLRGVELVKVGKWAISTGDWTVTAEDLVSAIEAHRAGVLRKPVVKLGHDGPMGDGAPALGYVDNLRLANGGQTLIGDLVNVPANVAKLIPHAYPSRSVEAVIDHVDQTGRTWPLVLDALALLGATAPGINTLTSLSDVGALYGVAASRVSIPSKGVQTMDTLRRTVQVAAARRRRAQRITTQKG